MTNSDLVYNIILTTDPTMRKESTFELFNRLTTAEIALNRIGEEIEDKSSIPLDERVSGVLLNYSLSGEGA